MNGKKGRIISMIMACILAFSTPAAVWADVFTNRPAAVAQTAETSEKKDNPESGTVEEKEQENVEQSTDSKQEGESVTDQKDKRDQKPEEADTSKENNKSGEADTSKENNKSKEDKKSKENKKAKEDKKAESDQQISGEEQTASVFTVTDEEVKQAQEAAIAYIQKAVTEPVVGTNGGEWSVMAMARSGYLLDSTRQNYLTNLNNTLGDKKGVLHKIKYTEYSRVIMAMSALGMDAHKAFGYDLFQPLADFEMVTKQGMNGAVFALIAFDTNGYEIPTKTASQKGPQTTREGIIEYLLGLQKPEGGWSLNPGEQIDDMTPMTIQALAPYYDQRADVKEAVDKALDAWSREQTETGGFNPGGGSETVSQTIIAFAALDPKLFEDPRFVKNGKTVIDGLLQYQLEDGSFSHMPGQGFNDMSTDQAALALTAYVRSAEGQNSLYDMRDVFPEKPAPKPEPGELIVPEGMEEALDYLEKTVREPVVDSVGGEWSVIDLARAGRLTKEVQNNYLSNLNQTLKKLDGKLSSKKYTEYSRVILALSAMGKDAHDVFGYDLIQPLADLKKVKKQGLNGPIFALIALDSNQYEEPKKTSQQTGPQTTRELLVKEILDAEEPGGGWALMPGGEPDDITPMAIQALAPYYGREDVKAAVDRALEMWSNKQSATGGFGEGEWIGSETISQTIIAFSALDKELFNDERFIKNGNTIIDALLAYQLEDGSFKHTMNGKSDLMATEQACLALVAYSRAINGQNSLYDMRDAFPKEPEDPTEDPENVKKFMDKVNALPSPVRIRDKDKVSGLIVELVGMKEFKGKEEVLKSLKAKQDDIGRQEKEVEAVDREIWNKIDPRNITVSLKPTVQAIRAKYNRLPEENKKFVEYYGDLVEAEKKIAELENSKKTESPKQTAQDQKNPGNKNSGKKPSSGGRRPMQMQASASAHVSSKKKTTSNTTTAKGDKGIVKATEINKIKGKDKNLKYEGEIKKDQKYTMTLHGKDVKESKDMNVIMKEGSVYEKDINKLAEDPYIFHFEQKGAFPAEMLVELELPVEDGEYLLLKYNSKDRKAEFVQKIEIKGKETKFLVKEGGDYFIAKKAKAGSLNDLESDKKDSDKDHKSKGMEKEKKNEKNVMDTSEKAKVEKSASSNLTILVTAVVVVLLAGAGGVWFYLKKGRGK